MLAEERATRNEKSVAELLVIEQVAKRRSQFLKAAILDEDDEDTIQMKEYYENSSTAITPDQNKQEDMSIAELLAEEQMEHIKAIYASNND